MYGPPQPPGKLPPPLALSLARFLAQPQHKIHHHRRKKRHSQHCWPEAVVEARLAPQPDRPRPPVEGADRVQHRRHRDDRKQRRTRLPDAVAKVKQPDREPAQDDGEVEPRQERALVGEEDLGLDACWERDALACASQGRALCVPKTGPSLPGEDCRSGWLDMVPSMCDRY